uniref:Uncharacterized protein n=1 Tax=Rhizophora mucronata TaxID=61149 RepID=A0A2P2K6E3_RHIMU
MYIGTNFSTKYRVKFTHAIREEEKIRANNMELTLKLS